MNGLSLKNLFQSYIWIAIIMFSNICCCYSIDISGDKSNAYFKEIYERYCLGKAPEIGCVIFTEPDRMAEYYLEIKLSELVNNWPNDSIDDRYNKWRNAIRFFVENTTMPWNDFPKGEMRAGDLIYIACDVDIKLEEGVLLNWRPKIINSARKWLNDRKGNIVYNYCYVGSPGKPKERKMMGAGKEGFCAIDEQIITKNLMRNINGKTEFYPWKN